MTWHDKLSLMTRSVCFPATCSDTLNMHYLSRRVPGHWLSHHRMMYSRWRLPIGFGTTTQGVGNRKISPNGGSNLVFSAESTHRCRGGLWAWKSDDSSRIRGPPEPSFRRGQTQKLCKCHRHCHQTHASVQDPRHWSIATYQTYRHISIGWVWRQEDIANHDRFQTRDTPDQRL